MVKDLYVPLEEMGSATSYSDHSQVVLEQVYEQLFTVLNENNEAC